MLAIGSLLVVVDYLVFSVFGARPRLNCSLILSYYIYSFHLACHAFFPLPSSPETFNIFIFSSLDLHGVFPHFLSHRSNFQEPRQNGNLSASTMAPAMPSLCAFLVLQVGRMLTSFFFTALARTPVTTLSKARCLPCFKHLHCTREVRTTN